MRFIALSVVLINLLSLGWCDMEIKYTNRVEESGCVFTGKLAVIDYTEHLKTLPSFGKAGAMSFYDALDDAKKVMFEKHPDAKMVLSIPVLVCEV